LFIETTRTVSSVPSTGVIPLPQAAHFGANILLKENKLGYIDISNGQVK
jgi:hypothetical protein